MHFYIFGFWQASNEAKTNEREPYNVRRNQRSDGRADGMNGRNGWRKKARNQTRHSNATITAKQYWFRYSVDVVSVWYYSWWCRQRQWWRWRRRRRQRRWWRHCFHFCFPLLSFFSTSRMPHTHTQNYKPRKIFVHTFSANINMHKSLMNLSHAYVLHWAGFVWFFCLHYFPVSYG